MLPLTAAEKQFQLSQAWSMRFAGWRRFQQREADRLLAGEAELPPPRVECVLTKLMLAAKRSYRLTAAFLLCDSLAPQFALLCDATLSSARGVHVMLTQTKPSAPPKSGSSTSFRPPAIATYSLALFSCSCEEVYRRGRPIGNCCFR
jgi:hypothetical protein